MDEALQVVPERGVEQLLRAEHVGLDEDRGVPDRAVDVRLGGEVDDGVDLGEEPVEQGAVADVALDEGVARGVGDGGEVRLVARVGQGVEHDHLGAFEARVGVFEGASDEVRADEAGAAGDEDFHTVPWWSVAEGSIDLRGGGPERVGDTAGSRRPPSAEPHSGGGSGDKSM
nr:hypothetical protein GCM10025699_46280 [Microbacterium flavescens]